MQNKHHYVAIMAGGIGSRFWPMSRTAYPKQFLDVLNTGKTLIQWTYERYTQFIPAENIFIVTSEEYVDIVKTQLPLLPVQNILAEPSKKNTAPCIAYISFKLAQIDPHATFIVAPSDHLILEQENFQKIVEKALDFVSNINALATLGIKPSNPNTGYGYIQYEGLEVSNGVYKVKTFTEKPTQEIAESFLASGDFLWNAGIFIWSVSSIKKAFKQNLPEQYDIFENAAQSFFTENEAETIRAFYEQCKSISIDYGIMEKAQNVYVIPSEFGWSDLGTWTSLYDISPKDENNNVVKGKHVFMYNVEGCLVNKSENLNGKIIALKSVKDLIIVDTPDVLLICDKSQEQEVKQIATDLKIKFNDKYT